MFWKGAAPSRNSKRCDALSSPYVPFARDAHVLDVGCVTGVLTRALARWPSVTSVIGVDPAPSLLERARSSAAPIE